MTFAHRAPRPAQPREPERNGIKAPQRDGAIMEAWNWFDAATGPVVAAHLPRLAQEMFLNVENLRIELRRWKRYHGIPRG
jgi:hypothetical protein